MSTPAFYKVFDAITSATFTAVDSDHFAGFGFHTTGIRIRHLGGNNSIFFSFTGQEDHGQVSPTGRVEVILEGVRASQIYLRGGDGTEDVEVSAYRAP